MGSPQPHREHQQARFRKARSLITNQGRATSPPNTQTTTSHKTQVPEGHQDYEDLHFRRDRKQVW